MEHRPTSTLSYTERALRPLVLLVTFACPILAAGLILASHNGASPLMLAVCTLLATMPAVSNLHYLATHELTTFGMMPVALSSLIPALVAALTAQPKGTSSQVGCAVALFALLVLAVVFCLWFCRIRLTYRTHPNISPDACIIVLGGAVKNGQPHRTLAQRLDTAALYWREQPSRTIVVSGGPTPDQSTTEADVMGSYLQRSGVAAERIMLERQARNTYENILLSLELLDKAGIQGQRCVVSSDYHLYRALRDARKLGVSLTPIAAPTPPASIPQQWCREVITILAGR